LPTIEFKNVSKRFGKIVALDRVSFNMQSGEYLCVLGPTGSGKTTLLRLIAGLLKPDEGEISFDGKSVNNIDAHNRNAVYVPQQYALFPHLTVLNNVAFGPLSRGKSENEALEIASKTLEIVRLAWRGQSYPNELSGGMQQRVALARGLASGASLLLLDEPLGALDARLRLELRHRLREMVKEAGFTAVHVTHDRDEAMSVADQILVLKRGRIQDQGPPRRIYVRPAGIFVANLIGGANIIEGVVESASVDSCTIRVRGGTTIHSPPAGIAMNQPVVISLRKESIEISNQGLQRGNALKGKIQAVRFLGNSREYLVRQANGDIIALRRFQEGFEPAFQIGESVTIVFQKDDVMTFAYPPQGLRKELEIE